MWFDFPCLSFRPSVKVNFVFFPCREMIRQDMEEWVTSEMWPLSCYAYAKETPCIEGFVDISTHELRWEAYQAFASGNAAKYVQTVNELVEKQMGVKKQFNSITADDVLSMVSSCQFIVYIHKGSCLCVSFVVATHSKLAVCAVIMVPVQQQNFHVYDYFFFL